MGSKKEFFREEWREMQASLVNLLLVDLL